MKNKNLRFILIIVISAIAVGILAIVGTFAFFGWRSEVDSTVDVTVVAGTGSCDLRSDNERFIEPTDNRNKGRVIKLDARQELSSMAKIEWNLIVNEINGLQDTAFNYEMVNSTTGVSYGSGTFENIEAGDTLTFSADEVLGYSRDYIFTLYLWIEGRFGNNNLTMADQLFDFDINCSLTVSDTGTVVEEHRMMASNAVDETREDGYFLRSTTVTRGEVDSITFLDNINIPTGDNIEVVDISENEGDNEVLMWYDKNGNDSELYDIFIGTNGGLIKLNSNSAYLFYYLSNVETLNLSKFDTSEVTDMSCMFAMCSGLTSLNISNFDTSNVTNMYRMFDRCTSLTSLDVSSFDTSNVENIGLMFQQCENVKRLDLSHFDTSSITNMQGVFNKCFLLEKINMDSFNTSNVTDMTFLFRYCGNLKSLDLSNFDTSNVIRMEYMFQGCNKLTKLDVSGWNTSSVTRMDRIFAECTDLLEIDLSSFNTSKVTNMSYMFYGCENLKTIYVSDLWTTKAVTSSSNMFGGATKLVGGSGTIFNSNKIDVTYARIDGGPNSSTPGYFTYKENA